MVEFPFSNQLKTRTGDGEVIPARNPWHYIERTFQPVEGIEPPNWIVVFADNADFEQSPPDGQPKRAFRIENGSLIAETDGTEPTNDEYFIFKRGSERSLLKFVVEHSGMSNDILFDDEVLIENTDNLSEGEIFELPGVNETVGEEETPPQERDPSESEDSEPSPRPSDEYRIEEGNERKVTFNGTDYYVVSDIPESDPDQLVVTTTEHEIVPTSRAKDVFSIHTWQDSTWQTDWDAELTRMQDLRTESERLELLGRATDLGWDLTEILVFTAAGIPSASIGTIVELGTDAISWEITDETEPYREAFGKLVACTKNGKDTEELASNIQSYDDMTNLFRQRVQATSGLASSVTDVAKIGQSWDDMITALKSGGGYTSAVNPALGAAKGMFIGFAVSGSVGAIENVVKAKTKIHAVTYDYASMRIPVLRTLQRLDNKLQSGSGTVGDILIYDMYLRANYQMNALLFDVGGQYWRKISESATGAIWDIIAGADQKAENFTEVSNTMREMTKYVDLLIGNSWQEVEKKTTNSINAEEFGVLSDG